MDKGFAYRAYKNAIESGKLARGQCCELCGECGFTEGHHTDYAFPLRVLWFCASCHEKAHKDSRSSRVWYVTGLDAYARQLGR